MAKEGIEKGLSEPIESVKRTIEPFRRYKLDKKFYIQGKEVLAGGAIPGLVTVKYQPKMLKMDDEFSETYQVFKNKLDVRMISYAKT